MFPRKVAPTVPSEVKGVHHRGRQGPPRAAAQHPLPFRDKGCRRSPSCCRRSRPFPPIGEDKSKTEEVKTDPAVGAAPVLVTEEVKQDAAAAVAAPAAITPSAPKVEMSPPPATPLCTPPRPPL
ncbi:predicted protein [Verticillium alfalfae VaMs.102]|uniref:Predicted protein n=1 Tax=Verticillium alfalfae (strain VaMs.102 / ATCC MYA-4576 / FGSC 10136) TaxID=526221 RepID=C9S609_VERA1|nr:predicted protein [Verticillium alfalfae VaMs.102]EEY14348.1 predicted protein [Verticillium alfalfae VaMs.102]